VTEQTTALAQQPAPRSLLNDLATAQGMDPTRFYNAIKTLCGCQGAQDEHFAGLMMVAREFNLNPILKHLYLMPTKRGVSVVMGVDGYLVFLRRAEKDGVIVRHDCEEGWFTDPRYPPDAKKTRRGFKASLWFKGEEAPRTHVEWFDEIVRDTEPWKGMPSRMGRHKAMSQAVRRFLGLYVMDTDEAAKIDGDAPRRVEAEVTDAQPVVPIRGVRPFAPPPAELDAPIIDIPQSNPGSVEASSEPTPSPSGDAGAGSGEPAASSAVADDEFSRALAEADAKKKDGLFS
jgi:hypothetical protein